MKAESFKSPSVKHDTIIHPVCIIHFKSNFFFFLFSLAYIVMLLVFFFKVAYLLDSHYTSALKILYYLIISV